TQADPFTPAPINYDEAASVFVSHTSTESNPTGAASLMILPDSLPFGIKAGQVFPLTTFRAIGGALNPGSDYIWSHTWIEPADLYDWGLTIIGNLLSGTSRYFGPISFTIVATDDNGDTDSHTFYGVIDPPDPLTLDVTPAPVGSKEGDTHTFTNPLATFTADGGVAPYSWTFTEVPVAPTSLPSGLSLQPTGNPGEMDLVGTLVAGEWNITVKITDYRLPVDATAFVEAGFTLCVSPLPLQINLPDAAALELSLGTEHTIQISVSNAKLPPTWIVTGLPNGLNVLNPAGSPLEIKGAPVFDPNQDYPATYQISVDVTDPFTWCGFGPRTESATFDIIVNPKAPEWDKEETNGGVATGVAADQNGNTYVTGYIGAEGSRDYLTVKYDPQGNKEWSVTYDGPSGSDDMAKAIAADETGAYVTGFSEGTTSGKDIYTIKYNPDGSKAWDFRYDGPSFMGDEPNAIALDEAHLYVAGFIHRGNVGAHKDYVIIKFGKDSGNQVWDTTYDSTRNGMDEVTAIAVDNSGNVYITGKSQEGGNIPKSFDYLTLKFNSSGGLLWNVRDDGLAFGDDEATAIAIDADGNVCVTGWQNMGVNDTNFYTVKYNTNGQSIWSSGQSYGGPGEDKALSVAFDDAGNFVYVTGRLEGSNGFDYATVKYDGAGAKIWDKIHDSGKGDDIPVGLAFSMENGEGFVYVAGFKTTQSNGKDYLCIKYKEADGSIVWIGQYNSGAGVDDEATAMFMNATGLYMTGFTPSGYLTVKYTK
ncbi:MAG: SBBP repeat-containing protein, partial [Dehalococcoidia bacterium]